VAVDIGIGDGDFGAGLGAFVEIVRHPTKTADKLVGIVQQHLRLVFDRHLHQAVSHAALDFGVLDGIQGKVVAQRGGAVVSVDHPKILLVDEQPLLTELAVGRQVRLHCQAHPVEPRALRLEDRGNRRGELCAQEGRARRVSARLRSHGDILLRIGGALKSKPKIKEGHPHRTRCPPSTPPRLAVGLGPKMNRVPRSPS